MSVRICQPPSSLLALPRGKRSHPYGTPQEQAPRGTYPHAPWPARIRLAGHDDSKGNRSRPSSPHATGGGDRCGGGRARQSHTWRTRCAVGLSRWGWYRGAGTGGVSRAGWADRSVSRSSRFRWWAIPMECYSDGSRSSRAFPDRTRLSQGSVDSVVLTLQLLHQAAPDLA